MGAYFKGINMLDEAIKLTQNIAFAKGIIIGHVIGFCWGFIYCKIRQYKKEKANGK